MGRHIVKQPITWVQGRGEPIGMTHVPGSPHGPHAGAIDLELERISHDTSQLVVLATPRELSAAGLEAIADRGLRMGLHVVVRPLDARRPMPSWLVDEIASWHRWQRVVYASPTGRGRASVAAACALVRDGYSDDEIIAMIPSALVASADIASHLNRYRRARVGVMSTGDRPILRSSDLRRSHVPPAQAPWHPVLSSFALLHDGYRGRDADEYQQQLVSALRVYERTGSVDSLDLDDARDVLFLLQRLIRNESFEASLEYDAGPDAVQLARAWALVERIRTTVQLP